MPISEVLSGALSDRGLSPRDWCALIALGYDCPRHRRVLARNIRCFARHCHQDAVTIAEARETIDSLLSRGLVMVVTTQAYAAMQALGTEYGKPIFGYPVKGDIDLTDLGAKLYLQLKRVAWPNLQEQRFATRTAWEYDIYLSDPLKVSECVASVTDDGATLLGDPIVVGPWRSYWWRLHANGTVVRARWDESSRAFGPRMRVPTPRLSLRPDTLKQHKLTFAVWAVLSYIGSGRMCLPPSCGRDVRKYVLNNSGPKLRAAEIEAALWATVRRGLVRVISDADMNETRQFLSTRRTLGPFELMPRRGMVDFTLDGARLYEKVQQSANGQEATVAHHLRLCEEHVYFTNSGAAQSECEELRSRGEDIAAEGPFKIGQWCVRWWQTYSHGYTLRVTRTFRNVVESAQDK